MKKLFQLTFSWDEEGGDPNIPLCRKLVVWVREDTAHGAEDYVRFRFDLGTRWKILEVKEAS